MNTDFESDPTVPEPSPTSVDPTPAGTHDPEITEQLQVVWEKVSGVLANLPDYVTEFFKEYQRPLITIGLIVGAVVSVKLLLAILNTINEIPLLAPTFELVGLTYAGWFVYRYLLKESNRQELSENVVSLRDQVLGKRG
ncbi:MAG: CAAD domain-containing protein [Cyanobacteria bacterium]|nr:CAAD domain-containing protein [Cyanobacteriota bacterium]MDA0866709.1 CAAD domain-containing protein [Cyanobacteriota bacterium]